MTYKYRGRSLKVVLTEWGLFTILVVLLAIFCYAFQKNIQHYPRLSGRSTVLVISFGFLASFLLNALLTIGVKKGQSSALKIWHIVQIALIVVGVLHLLMELPGIINSSKNVPKTLGLIFLFLSVFLGYKAWSIHVIVKFRYELISSTNNVYTNVVYNRPITEKV